MTSDARERREPIGPGDLTVGRAAALVGVSVKTLHHWDAIGLVRPSGRTWAGYRVYSGGDALDHLRRQRSQLVERIARLETMVRAVDRAMEASKPGMRLTPEEQVEIFGADWQPAWVDEAEDRWGDSAQWAQYAERAAEMTPRDWQAVADATGTLTADLAAAKRARVAPGSDEANTLAERHRALLSTYFDCTHSMQVCIGRMYVREPGYAEGYDAAEPGLTAWLRDVIFANAEARGVDPASAVWE